MDRLSDIPTTETELTPDEKSVINRYFGNKEGADAAPSDAKKTATSWAQILKVMMFATGAFIFLSNPVVDSLLCKLPRCDSAMTLLAVKTLLFMIFMVLLQKYVM